MNADVLVDGLDVSDVSNALSGLGPILNAPRAQGAFPPRAVPGSWPATTESHDDVLALLTSEPFLRPSCSPKPRAVSVRLLLAWLGDLPGQTWQDRWLASGADAAGVAWRQVPASWLQHHGHPGPTRRDALVAALPVAISADIVRPSLAWLVDGGLARGGLFVPALEASRDPEGFARLRAHCLADKGVSVIDGKQMLYRCALILAAKGGTLAQITVGDLVQLFATEDTVRASPPGARAKLYRILHELGILDPTAPTTLRVLSTAGQRTPDELIDRYRLSCRPIRDLLVDYLRERQAALDYTSVDSLAYHLGMRFWADIEAHHPQVTNLHLPREVADDWKRRLQTITKSTRGATGEKAEQTVERINYRECLTPVRAFYLDLAHWAVEDPARWGPWVAPCPVGAEEVSRKKATRHRKARMDARTRDRLPVLPTLIRSLDERRKSIQALLRAADRAEPGEPFTVNGATLTRSVLGERSISDRVLADDPHTGKRRDLSREEDHAFWSWAIVEVLRATGVRVEELLELSHHSLVQYRLPTTGELIPLLQIAPSKTDTERLLVVSPELADVLSTIICRVRGAAGAVPLVVSYDRRERIWSAPTPLLFQRQIASENRPIPVGGVSRLLAEALAHTGLRDAIDGQPLHYTPHDFRRIFITDAILNGLPPHIAQIIAGHRDINVTLGYKAIYPEEAIQAHLAFLARRRALRPSEEYRLPTEDEWEEFLGHFERRKVSTGTCARAFGTPCIHEHACIRCSMLWPDPAQRDRLTEIRDNLHARIAEAKREGWLGETEGLQVSLAGAEEKLSQLKRRPAGNSIVNLGMPTIS